MYSAKLTTIKAPEYSSIKEKITGGYASFAQHGLATTSASSSESRAAAGVDSARPFLKIASPSAWCTAEFVELSKLTVSLSVMETNEARVLLRSRSARCDRRIIK